MWIAKICSAVTLLGYGEVSKRRSDVKPFKIRISADLRVNQGIEKRLKDFTVVVWNCSDKVGVLHHRADFVLKDMWGIGDSI